MKKIAIIGVGTAGALSVAHLSKKTTLDLHLNNVIPIEKANERYRSEITGIENILMMHYYAGSTFKTQFWEFAQDRAKRLIDERKNDPLFRKFIDRAKIFNQKSSESIEYGTWSLPIMNLNLNNLSLTNLL